MQAGHVMMPVMSVCMHSCCALMLQPMIVLLTIQQDHAVHSCADPRVHLVVISTKLTKPLRLRLGVWIMTSPVAGIAAASMSEAGATLPEPSTRSAEAQRSCIAQVPASAQIKISDNDTFRYIAAATLDDLALIRLFTLHAICCFFTALGS